MLLLFALPNNNGQADDMGLNIFLCPNHAVSTGVGGLRVRWAIRQDAGSYIVNS